MTRDQIISIFFIALLVFITHQLYVIFIPFRQAIFWSAVMAFAFYPLYDILKKWMQTPDWIPALAMTILIALIVVPPVIFLIINITSQAIELSQRAVDYVREGHLENLIQHIRSFTFVQRIEARVGEIEILRQSLESWLLNSTKSFGNFTASQFATLTKNTLLIVLNLVATLILTFVFLKDGHVVCRFIYDSAPLDDAPKKAVFDQINGTLSAVLRGQILTSLVQSLLAAIIYSALGLPLPILLALVTFVTSLIPVIGASGVWIPLVIFLVFQQMYVKAIILFLLGTLLISMIDNILKPAIIGERTKLPYFLLFFGILGGLKIYGLMGVFLAPVVLSLFFALVQIYRERYQ